MDEVQNIKRSVLLKGETKYIIHREYIFTAVVVEGGVSPVRLCKRYNCQSEGAANSNGMFPREWGCMAFSDPGKHRHTRTIA